MVSIALSTGFLCNCSRTFHSSDDSSIANKAWNKYVINGFVALPHSWATNKLWPKARDMPGDPDKGIYVVDGFHQLHCLVKFYWGINYVCTLIGNL